MAFFIHTIKTRTPVCHFRHTQTPTAIKIYRGDFMFELIKAVFGNLLFFFLHLKNASSFPKPLSAEKEKELLYKMKKQGDTKAREALIEHNLRLVSHIIKKYYSGYDEQEDLISIGTIGLIKAIDSFDIDKGIRFATYGARCIENAIHTSWIYQTTQMIPFHFHPLSMIWAG